MKPKWFLVKFFEPLPASEREISAPEEYERMRSEWNALEKSIDELYELSALGKLLAHLINQRVVHVDTAEDLLCFLLNEPSDQNVNLAVGFVTECGPAIQCLSPDYIYADCVRSFDIERDGELGKKIHGLVLRLFDIITSEAQSRLSVRPELDFVDEKDQMTHFYSFFIAVEPLNSLDTFSSSFFINRETSLGYMS